MVDAGTPAYYSGRPLIDILGLNDEHIAHTPDKSNADFHRYYRPYAAGATDPYFPIFFIRDENAPLP